MATNPMRLSADDLLDIDVPPHLRGYELENGELVEVTPVSFTHGCIAAELAMRLTNHVRKHHIAGYVCVEGGYVLRLPSDAERLRGPDLSFVSEANLQAHGGAPRRGFLRLIPELVVEIDSPGREPPVERERIRNYLDAGVRLLWVVHTVTRSATVYVLDGSSRSLRENEVLEGADILPGLRIPLRAVFERAPPELPR